MSNTMESDPGLAALQLAREWPAMFMVGLITLGLGIAVISWPQETLKVISILIGLQILIQGIYRLITALRATTRSRRASPVSSASSASSPASSYSATRSRR